MSVQSIRHTAASDFRKRYKKAEGYGRFNMFHGLPMGALLLVCSSTLLAQDRAVIEEIIVVAQRVEENAGSVPIALNAFNEAMIEDRQIIGLADLQIFVPNLSFTTNNVADMVVSVRGVGSLVAENDGESGVSLHINEVPLPPGQLPFELFDLQQIEVLRGPQGTLYGRNATGGVVNFITHKPNFDGFSGYIDAEGGQHDLLRLRGAVNFPVSDTLALRIAGLSLERDGYVNNLAGGQVPGVSDHIDSRDLYSVRASAVWRLSERTELSLMYERFDKNDSQIYAQNNLCAASTIPVQPCETGVFGLDAANPAAITFAFDNGLRGLVAPGAQDAATGLVYRYPRPEITRLLDVHVDHEPDTRLEQNIWQLAAQHQFDWGTVSLIGGHQEWTFSSSIDTDWSVGHELNPIAEVPDGIYAVSSIPGGRNGLTGDECNLQAGQAGYLGGCTLRDDLSRSYWYGETVEDRDQWSVELKLRTEREGRLNVLVGASYRLTEAYGRQFGFQNDLVDQLSSAGVLVAPARFLRQPGPTFRIYAPFGGAENETEFESISGFGELYVDLSSQLSLTLGVRYNRDEKQIADRNVGPLAFDINSPFLFNGLFGDEVVWGRFAALFDPTLADFYGIPPGTSLPEVFAQVPIAPPLNETRLRSGTPTEQTWDAWTGRMMLDWQPTADTLVYASYARGYKPGGFNPGTTVGLFEELGSFLTYEREDVNAFEIGTKLLLNGSLRVNAAVFFNDYKNLQLNQAEAGFISNRPIATNVDAEMFGGELEVVWRPGFAPRAEVELGYAWMNAEVKRAEPRVDPLNRTGGNTDYIAFGGPGGPFIARAADVLPLGAPAVALGIAVGPAEVPTAQYSNGIPAWWLDAGGFLAANGADVRIGIPTTVAGNRIPEAPEHNVHIGLAYTWDVAGGALTARWDYYWQDHSYMTIFNRPWTRIDSWDQHNATLIYESGDGRWSARAWIKNIEDDLHITGGNRAPTFEYFGVSDPRAWGASLRWNFGAL